MDWRELMAWLFLLYVVIGLAYIIWDTYFVPDESDPDWHEQWEEQELAKARASCEATIEYLKEVAARPVPRWPEIKLPDNLFDNCIRCAPSYDPIGLCVKAPDTLGPFVFRNNLNDVSLGEWLLNDKPDGPKVRIISDSEAEAWKLYYNMLTKEPEYKRPDYQWLNVRR